MRIVLIATMALCLLGMVPTFWLGVSYVYAGQGLHPVLSGIGVLVLIGLGWQAACAIDSE